MKLNEALFLEDKFDFAVLWDYTLPHICNFGLLADRRPSKTIQAYLFSNRLSYFGCYVFPPHCQASVNKPAT